MSWIGVGITILDWGRRAFGMVTPEPLGPPRMLTYLEDTTAPDGGVTFTWQPPSSFGQAGPHATARYGYQVRVGAVGGTLMPWSMAPGVARLNTNTVRIGWAQAGTAELMEFRVFAYDANDVQSPELLSPVLRESEVMYPPPRRLRFTEAPLAQNPRQVVSASWLAPEQLGIAALSGYDWQFRSRGPRDGPYRGPRMGYSTLARTTGLTVDFTPWLDDDAPDEQMEFRVQAVYADGGRSVFLDSGGVVVEGTILPPAATGGRFAGRWSGRFG